MNERIKKIWDDAALEAGDESNTWEAQVNFLDKFAQMIVRECAQVADERPDVLVDNSTAGLILQHFGLK